MCFFVVFFRLLLVFLFQMLKKLWFLIIFISPKVWKEPDAWIVSSGFSPPDPLLDPNQVVSRPRALHLTPFDISRWVRWGWWWWWWRWGGFSHPRRFLCDLLPVRKWWWRGSWSVRPHPSGCSPPDACPSRWSSTASPSCLRRTHTHTDGNTHWDALGSQLTAVQLRCRMDAGGGGRGGLGTQSGM